ncbi:MAG: hypothetical protein IKH78_03215 [Ruminococcus sp.]|nr:hypothetical protein [Ruminococcus sp.]
MEQITSAVRSICILSVGMYLVSSITEGTRLRAHTELLVKMIFAVTVAIAAINCVKDFELPDTELSERRDSAFYVDIYDRELARNTSENISDVLRAQIEAEGITVEKIDTEVNISETGSIFISRVIIGTSDNEAAAAVIRRSLGESAEVVNGDQ